MQNLIKLAAKNIKQYSFGLLFLGVHVVHFRVVHWGSPWAGGQCFVHHHFFCSSLHGFNHQRQYI